MNITEKILSKKAGHEVIPGEIIEIPVDLAMSHDGTSPPAIKTFEKLADKVWDSDKIAIIFDHNIPANTIGSAEFQKVYFPQEWVLQTLQWFGRQEKHGSWFLKLSEWKLKANSIHTSLLKTSY